MIIGPIVIKNFQKLESHNIYKIKDHECPDGSERVWSRKFSPGIPSELGTVVVCTFGGSPGGDTVKTVESHAGYDLLLGYNGVNWTICEFPA